MNDATHAANFRAPDASVYQAVKEDNRTYLSRFPDAHFNLIVTSPGFVAQIG